MLQFTSMPNRDGSLRVSIAVGDRTSAVFVDRADALPAAQLSQDIVPNAGVTRNEELRRLLRLWLVEAQSALDGKKIPRVPSSEIGLFLKEDDTYNGHHHSLGGPDKPSFELLVESFDAGIWNRPALNQLLEFGENDHTIFYTLYCKIDVEWTPTDDEFSRWNFYALYLRPFLVLHLRYIAAGYDEETSFSHLYNHLE